MRTFIVALSFLTRLPMRRVVWRDGDFARAVRLYPLVGLVVGALVAAAGWLGALIDPWLGALLALVLWTWVTGALHLDGLADLADGLGAWRGDRERLLTVMAEPLIGSFGTVTLIVQIAAKLVLLHLLLPAHWLALVAIPAAARLGPLIWARFLPPLRPDGMGAAIADAVSAPMLIGWGVALLAAGIMLPALLTAPLFYWLMYLWTRRRLGGITGDVHGAGVELVETGLLLALVVYAAA